MAALHATVLSSAAQCSAAGWQTPAARSSPVCAAATAALRPRGPAFVTRSASARAPRRLSSKVYAQPQATGAKGVAIAVNDSNWDDLVLKSTVPVLVDFWAPWCGPCRMIAPIIDELAAEYGDRLLAVKLNTDESPGVATEYGIRSIPTVMVFKDGKKQDTVIGAVPKTTLVQTVDKYVD